MNRKLTNHEYELIKWLLSYAENSKKYLEQLEDIIVVNKCKCGCASIDFKVDNPKSPLKILADYMWYSKNNNPMGIFVFSKSNQLAGLEVWSINGEETPTTLPQIEELIPLES